MEFVRTSKVTPTEAVGNDLGFARAAWVSNLSEDGAPVLPDYIKTVPWQIRAYEQYNDIGRLDPRDVERLRGLIKFLYRERHMSPFEHGSMSCIIDTPIFVAREFMRHRTFSYNEVSGRYKELEPRFYVIGSQRPVIQKGKVGAYSFDSGSDEQYGTTFAETTDAYEKSWDAYQTMLKAGVAREVARNVLPVGIMTQFKVTGNPRNWMQFLTLRNDSNALYEIREVAVQIEKAFAARFPLTYEAYKEYDWRTEKDELKELRAKVAQLEAFETYNRNISASTGVSGLLSHEDSL